jgi:hypothetical protein
VKKYLPCTNGQELEIHVYYSRDSRRRGYYLWVTPVTRTEFSVSSMLFSGESILLNEVTRKSAKAEREALELAARHERGLIEKVLKKNDLTLLEGVGVKHD